MKKIVLTLALVFACAAFTGCNDKDDADTSADTSIDTDIVSATPYARAGDWQGHTWTSTGATAGGTINELNQNYILGTDSACVSGNLVADYDSLGTWNMNVNQPVDGAVQPWTPGTGYTGVTVDVTINNFPGDVRLALVGTDGNTYCANLQNGVNTFEWTDFNTTCWWGGGSEYYHTVAIESVLIYAAGDQNETRSFDFCVNDLRPVAGSIVIDTDFDTGTPLVVNKFVGNITTTWQANMDYSGLKFADHWDQITPENAGKWGEVQSARGGAMDWSKLDAIYAYAEDNNIAFKQHAFVWGSQEPQNAAQMQEEDVKNWMTDFCTRYPNTAMIDVVNEPPPHTEPAYAANIGGGTRGDWMWVINAFNWAREACPNAILILNDYNNIEWPDENQNFINIANAVLEAGAPLDALGAQAHGLGGDNVSTATMKRLLAKLHDDTGLPVYISEYDISTKDDMRQLDLYKEHIPYFLETEYVAGITIWGWIVGQTWSQAADSGLVDDGKPRPAMTWLMNSLSRPVP